MNHSVSDANGGYQVVFHARFADLTDRHIRALAFLLDAPGLLDRHATAWLGRIASVADIAPDYLAWLKSLQQSQSKCAVLHDYLSTLHSARLGLYAEKLLAFFLQDHNILYRHSLQVRAEKNDTIGEFDFLIAQPDGLLHWELATKFYLLAENNLSDIDSLHGFVGPNLADTLGLKIARIFSRQLILAEHPASRAMLAQPVTAAQALIKGWLFYPLSMVKHSAAQGIFDGHCRGLWCTWSEFPIDPDAHYRIAARMEWLAPMSVAPSDVVDAGDISRHVAAQLAQDHSPFLLAVLEPSAGQMLEVARYFIVPDNWREQASHRIVID